MKKNNLSWILGLLFVMALGVASCSDEFNEEEFIQKQADLAESKAAADHQRALEVIQAQLQATLAAIEAQKEADTELAQLQALLQQELQMLMQSLQDKEDSTAAANYLAAYRAAGLFTEFTVVVNDRDGEPLADAEVRVSSIADAVTTGADGMAVFTDVVVGNNTLTVTSDAILDFRANILFNRLQVFRMGTSSVVEPATAMLALNLFAQIASSDEVGTIAGTVTIETDLTNDTPEFPTGAVVSADLTNYLTANNVIASQNGLGGTSNLALTEGDMGVGEIDPTTGNYELVVPVAENGSNVNLIFPEITADQTLAISERDGNEIPAEIATVPARFNLGTPAENVEAVAGFEVTVNEPATLGTGFELDFSPIPFILNPGFDYFFLNAFDINGVTRTFQDQFGNSVATVNIKQNSKGSGYSSSPYVVTGNDTIGYGALIGYVSSLNVVNRGSGYGNQQNVDLQLQVFADGNNFPLFTYFKSIQSGSDGRLPSSITVEEGDFNNFTESYKRFFTNNRIDSVNIVVNGAGSDGDVSPNMNFESYGLVIQNPDLDRQFTEFPAISVVGGGATEQATFTATTFNRFDISIASAGTGYTIEPNFTLEGRIWDNNQNQNQDVSTGDIMYIAATNPLENQGFTLSTFLERDGEGGIEYQNETYRIRTSANNYYLGEPTLKMELNTSEFEVNVFVDDPDLGSLNAFVLNNGSGYDSPRSVTINPRIAGAAGSGFIWEFNEIFNNQTGEYILNSAQILDQGTDYKQNLNMVTQQPIGSRTISVNVRRGETTSLGITNYGTGVRLENVGGDN